MIHSKFCNHKTFYYGKVTIFVTWFLNRIVRITTMTPSDNLCLDYDFETFKF